MYVSIWFKRFWAVVAVLSLGLVAACGSDSGSSSSPSNSGASKQPFQVLYVSGLTGLLAPSAKGVERGIQAAVDDLNKKGGIDGRQIELSSKDNQSDPTRGVTLVQEALNSSHKPDLVIPGVSTNESLAVAPLLSRNKVVAIGASSSAQLDDPAKFPYYFSVSALQDDVLAAVAVYVAGQGAHKVAVVGPNDGLGDAVGDVLKKEFRKAGVKSSDTRYASDGVDYSAAFTKALGGHPDWMFVEGAGAQVGHLLTSRIKAGAEKVPTIAGVTMGSQPLLDLAKGTNQMENMYMVLQPTQVYHDPADRSKEFNTFFSAIKAQGPIKVALSTYAAGWEAVKIWAAGLENVDGTINSDTLKASLESLPPAGDERIQYKTTFTAKSHYVDAQPEEFTIAKPKKLQDGMFVVEK